MMKIFCIFGTWLLLSGSVIRFKVPPIFFNHFGNTLIMEITKEIWNDVADYEGAYKVSNLGRVSSLKYGKIRILSNNLVSTGYYHVSLSLSGVVKNKAVHQLVAASFLNHKPDGTRKLVVNHIDFDKSNNSLYNLEVITHRENSNKKHIKSTSKYVGVHWDKSKTKWIASIRVNYKSHNLGRFNNEEDASKAYQSALKKLKIYYQY